jgi:hypothetical protein
MNKAFVGFWILLLASRFCAAQNLGYIGQKNQIKLDLVSTIFSKLYGVTYTRSIFENIGISGSYSYHKETFGYLSSTPDPVQYVRGEADANGSRWGLAMIWSSPKRPHAIPMGSYRGFGFDRYSGTLIESNSSGGYTYAHRNVVLKFLYGRGIPLGNKISIDLLLEIGGIFGTVKPMDSPSAFREPDLLLPVVNLFKTDNAFYYYSAEWGVSGLNNLSTAIVKYRQANLFAFPKISFAWLF